MLRFNTNEVRLSQVETSVEDSSALISTSSSALIMPLDEPPPPQPPQTLSLQQHQQQQELRHSSRRQAAADNDDILLLLLTPESEIRKSQSTRKKKRGSASSFSSSSTSTAAAAASAAAGGRKGTTTTRPPPHRPSPNWKERDSLVLQDVFWEQELADYATSQDTSIVHRLAQLAHDPNLCDYTESILYEMTRKLQASQSLLLTDPEGGGEEEEKAPLLLEEQLHAALTLTLWSVALVGLLPGPECEDVQWGLDCLHVMPKLSSSLESLAPLAALQKQQQQKGNNNNNNNSNLSLLLRRLVLEWVEHHRVAIRSMPRGYPFSPQQGGLLERTVHAALELFCHYLAQRTTRRMTWMERTTKATKMLWETVGWNTQIMRRTKAIPLVKKPPLQPQQKRQATSAAYRDELRYLQMAQGILLGSNNAAPNAAMLLGKVHAHEILQLVVKHNHNNNHNNNNNHNTLSLSLSSSSRHHHHHHHPEEEESHHGNYNNHNNNDKDKSTWLLTKGEVEERIRSILDDSLHHYSIPQQQQQQQLQQQQQQQALSLPMMKFPKLELHNGSPPHSESTVLLESEEANGIMMMKASEGNGLVDDNNDHDDDNDPDVDETKYRCCCLIPDSTQKQQ